MEKVIRIAITLSLVVLAVLSGRWIWNHYLYSPWTRDGRVQADVITISPDVSGWVTTLGVQDNAKVKQGDLLFSVDDKRYQAAVDELSSNVESKKLALELAEHEYNRRQNLHEDNAISAEELESSRINAHITKAEYDLAKAELETAKINLERTIVSSPVNGTVVNLSLREGNYVNKGTPVLSVVKANSLYVTGYFEETKLPLIYEGQEATINLMSGGESLTGTVTSIGSAIADNNATQSGQLLPQVQQTFNWVRLAQRVPVDIRFDNVPENTRLVAGMTASIRLNTD